MEEIKLALAALEQDGELSASRVLEAARDPASPLHASFEWDDSEAAEQYRLQQARHLIRMVVVVVGEENPTPTKLYVNVNASTRSEGRYVRLDHLEGEDYDRALDAAVLALDIARRRIEDLQGFAGKPLNPAKVVKLHKDLETVQAQVAALVAV